MIEKMKMTPPDFPNSYYAIVDMGFLWRQASPSQTDRELCRRSGREFKWKDFTNKIVNILSSRHTNAVKIFCVNDVYDLRIE